MRLLRKSFLAVLLGGALLLPSWRPARAASGAVVLIYHRFGETAYPTTDTRLDQFDAQLKALKSGGYHVLPLPEIVAALRAGRLLPERTVAITIDDAFRSVYTRAWPRLKRAGLPFTLFVATDAVDAGGPEAMTWDEVRELARAGVTIGAHSAAHSHLPAQRLDQDRRDLEKSLARFKAELGSTPELFAYPYGEASAALEKMVKGLGFIAAFGQQSGVVTAGADRYYLPRFPMNEHYGALPRFRTVIDTLPLHIRDLVPSDPMLGPNPPPFAFTVAAEDAAGLGRLTCYASNAGAGPVPVTIEGRRVRVRLVRPFAPGRGRVNCTLPAGQGRWRWFGMQYYVPVR